MRSNACIWDFSSTASTIAATGGSRYNPTMSRTFSMNCGSVDSFHESTRCGLSPNARQIRETAVWFNPAASAIDRVDQCESPPGGGSSRVLTTTASTASSVNLRGAPGRGSSESPSSRLAMNRDRHLPTMSRDTPSRAATRVLGVPSAHANTIRARDASACDDFARRAHRVSVCRSSSDNTREPRALPGIPKV